VTDRATSDDERDEYVLRLKQELGYASARVELNEALRQIDQLGLTDEWDGICERNEWFDGEVEITLGYATELIKRRASGGKGR
jgi:hypothetical protein